MKVCWLSEAVVSQWRCVGSIEVRWLSIGEVAQWRCVGLVEFCVSKEVFWLCRDMVAQRR